MTEVLCDFHLLTLALKFYLMKETDYIIILTFGCFKTDESCVRNLPKSVQEEPKKNINRRHRL